MNQLIPALAATVVPAVTCLAIAYPLRGQSGRHTTGLIARVPAGANPYDERIRAAVRHFAPFNRETGLAVNTAHPG